MLRSMFSAVSGLRNHQLRMDVIGNNIANVNTVGFKASRVTFKDVFSQTIRGASSPQVKDGSPVVGGMNPMQIGLGMSIGTIDTIHGRSSIETTGKNTDLAIDGDGYFKVRIGNSEQYFFTRAGNFEVSKIGDTSYLVHAGTGYKVVGRNNTDITIPMESIDQAKATTAAVAEGNLNSSTGLPYRITGSNGTPPTSYNYELLPQYSTTLEVVDSLGDKHVLTMEYRLNALDASNTQMTATGQVTDVTVLDNLKADPNTGWTCTVKTNGSGASITSGGTFNLKFKSDGTIDNTSTTSQDLVIDVLNSKADDVKVKLDLSHLIQQSGDFTVSASRDDGYAMGSMDSFSIDANGNVIGNFTNGQNRTLGQLSLARFLNPGGLVKVGDNLFQESNSSGQAISGFPNEGGFGKIAASSLEMSNVDLSQEFTNMITTQRGFQANSRVITTSDEILQELVNLKR